MMLSEKGGLLVWKERKTLYVSITWRTHQDQGKKEKWMDGMKKIGAKFSLILKQQ